jgi:hypothetical protein
MKFRWARANRPESGFPYVYHQLDLYDKGGHTATK